jgi:hypothetical protein
VCGRRKQGNGGFGIDEINAAVRAGVGAFLHESDGLLRS